MTQTTLDPQDVANFNALADRWWDETGPFKPLHQMNPCRLKYIKGAVEENVGQDFTKLKLLDVGCGGGLLSEPLCRLGFKVTALDAGLENINAAKEHAELSGLSIDYIHQTVEEYAPGAKPFDVITCLELIEHVSNPQLLVDTCAGLLKPGGILILSTLNKTIKSLALGIGVAEYILRWIPRGTHNWSQFLRPSQMAHLSESAGLQVQEIRGMAYNPITAQWSLSDDLDINYLMVLKKG